MRRRSKKKWPALEVDNVIGIVARGACKQVQVRRHRNVVGFDFLDVRVWARTWGAQPYEPTEEGFALAIELAPALLEILAKAVEP